MNPIRHIFFTSALITSLCTVQAAEWTLERITTLDGLSENFINCLFQDSRGFIWIGTNDGLNRYDGYEFRTYQLDPMKENWIQSNLVFDIVEDMNGDLWIGTNDHGVFRYDYSLDVFEHMHASLAENPLEGNHVREMMLNNDVLIVGTTTGLNCIRTDQEQPVIIHIMPGTDATNPLFLLRGLAYASENHTWVASQRGLHLLMTDSTGNNHVTPLYHPDVINILTIASYGDGVLLGTDNGIFYHSKEAGYRQINNLAATRIMLDRDENMWAATEGGLHILQKDPETAQSWSEFSFLTQGHGSGFLSNDQITDLLEDSYGNIWIGTRFGINKYNPSQKQFLHFGREGQSGNLVGEHIRTIYEDMQQNIWIGTDGGGISFLPRDAALKKNYMDLRRLTESISENLNSGYDIDEFQVDDQPFIFIGTDFPSVLASFRLVNGLPERVPLPHPFGQISGMVFTIAHDDKNLWLGTYDQGLYRYNSENRELQVFTVESGRGLASNIIRDLLVDDKGNVWIGTGGGLNMLNNHEKHEINPDFQVFRSEISNPTSISNNYILTLFQSSTGTIWIGTMGGGLNRHLQADEFERIDVRDGLPNNAIKGILEDESGNLWISSNKGLTKYGPGDGSISNFDLYDGLQDFEFGEHACVKLHDGEMLFGGMSGFNAFYPDDIRIETTPPDMVFTDFQVLHRSVKVGKSERGKVILAKNINELEKLKLRNQFSSFSIHFAALHYSASFKNQYRYMLEGFDEDWIRTDAKTTFARYTNLKPGKYTFKVMGSNNDGIWNPEPLLLDIHIVPPFWATWIAFILYGMLFIIGSLFFNRYTFIRIKEKNKLMMEHFEREKIQELSQMKLKFYTNISHEFRTPLTLIIGQMQSLIKNLEKMGFEKIKQKNLIIFRNAKMLLRLINQLMDFRKLEQEKMTLKACRGNLYLSLKEIFESFEEIAYQKEIEFTFKSFSRNIEFWYDAEKIEKIFYNLLSNAFNYTKNCGLIQITIKDPGNEFLEISVSDTGIGIPDHIKEHIFERFYQAKEIRNRDVGSTGIGLALTKGLVELHKGKIDFTSKKGAGTKFTVFLLKGENHFEECEKARDPLEEILHERETPDLPPQNQREEFEIHHLSSEKQGKVLVVEDNMDLRNFLQESLEDLYHVQTAVDGKDALAYLQWFEPDLLISDIKMPRMDGIELCKRLKNNENTSHIPIMMLTSVTSEEAHIEGYEAGADAYVPKPFSLDVLMAQVKALLRRKDEFRKEYRKDIEFVLEDDSLTLLDKKLLRRTRELIEQNIMDPDYSVLKLAGDYGLSQDNLNKKLKALIGMTAKSYIRSVKLKRAARLLATGRYTVAEVTYDVGFSDLKYFRKAFKNEFDVSPSEFKSLKA